MITLLYYRPVVGQWGAEHAPGVVGAELYRTRTGTLRQLEVVHSQGPGRVQTAVRGVGKRKISTEP